MYQTQGVNAVATITELRSDTASLMETCRETGKGILIQKNNEPYAVILSWDTYLQMKESVADAEADSER